MSFDYSKLLGRIVEIFGTRGAFGEAMGWANSTLWAKLNNKVEWTQGEIKRGARLLSIEDGDISLYFFTPKVQKTEPEEVV